MPPGHLLVTGAAGFIGSSFVRIARSAGYKIIILDALTYAGHLENLSEILDGDQVVLVQGDIADPVLVPSLLKKHSITALLNFAAETHVDRSITGPAAFIQTNIVGTYNLLSSALSYRDSLGSPKLKEDFRYLQVSTDEVYGALSETDPKFTETTPMAPNSPYSASKASGDLLVRAWFHTYGLPVITTNTSNNYGPRQYPEKLIPHMIACALSGGRLPVYGNGKNIRDWIHVDDHAAGILLALEKGKPGDTYLFGGNSERQNLDVVRSICKELDVRSPRADKKSYAAQIEFVTDRLGHDWRYAIDDSRAQKELGFKRKYEFESGLSQTVQWYLDNSAWSKAVTFNTQGAGKKS